MEFTMNSTLANVATINDLNITKSDNSNN